jgi:NADPH:quinone reductase-like Zn-dependent oxidoreductase
MNPKGGFYAEYIAVAAENVAPIPKPLDLRRAGAVPVIGLTALQGIDGALRLKRGERIIIHGASGGVGTMAVQFARLRGAKVFATASGKDGVARGATARGRSRSSMGGATLHPMVKSLRRTALMPYLRWLASG